MFEIYNIWYETYFLFQNIKLEMNLGKMLKRKDTKKIALKLKLRLTQ